jgi:glutathione S-transferase
VELLGMIAAADDPAVLTPSEVLQTYQPPLCLPTPRNPIRALALWEGLIEGEWLAGGGLSAADFTLFPEIALGRRIAQRNPGLVEGDLLGPRLQAWMARMEALPVVRKTWPPHWRPSPES